MGARSDLQCSEHMNLRVFGIDKSFVESGNEFRVWLLTSTKHLNHRGSLLAIQGWYQVR